MTTRCGYCGAIDGGHTMTCQAIHSDEEKPEQVEVLSCEHEFTNQDDSFDHEFGTEVIVYQQCQLCGETREMPERDPSAEAYDYDD